MSHKLFSKIEHILRLNHLDKRQVGTLKELYEEITLKLSSIKDQKTTAFTTEEANSVRRELTEEERHYSRVKHDVEQYLKKHSIHL